MTDRDELADSLRTACDWLVNVAQVQTEAVEEKPTAPSCPCYCYADWRGATSTLNGIWKPVFLRYEPKP